jgi:hypothetical protein
LRQIRDHLQIDRWVARNRPIECRDSTPEEATQKVGWARSIRSNNLHDREGCRSLAWPIRVPIITNSWIVRHAAKPLQELARSCVTVRRNLRKARAEWRAVHHRLKHPYIRKRMLRGSAHRPHIRKGRTRTNAMADRPISMTNNRLKQVCGGCIRAKEAPVRIDTGQNGVWVS